MARSRCIVPECGKDINARGYCHRHYGRWLRYGDPEFPSQRDKPRTSHLTPIELLNRTGGWRVSDSGCWEWCGAINPDGYGKVTYHGRAVGAHRVAYEAWIGPIPDGLFVCHTCDNRKCISPEHLWVGTNADNMADMSRKGRSRHSNAKLNWDSVRVIRQSPDTNVALGERYGVHPSVVSKVRSGTRWIERDQE